MDKETQEKSDHDLLIEVHVLLSNHLKHSDRLVNIALTAAIFGAVNFGFGLLFLLVSTGILKIGYGG